MASKRKTYRTTVDVAVPYLYMPQTAETEFTQPYQSALYRLENSMSPQIFMWDPSRLAGDAKGTRDVCQCDECAGRRDRALAKRRR